MNAKALIQKYNQQGPRYTSYPPVPFWKINHWEKSDWIETIRKGQQLPDGTAISIYVHLPYCESLCTFCGCHKYITTNHSVEHGYIDSVLKEWKFIASHLAANTSIAEIHLGGGTPTFFAPNELKRLIDGLISYFPLSPNAEMGFEAHPNSTSSAHLDVLYQSGFRRVSFGIQDYDHLVQQAIHRIQSLEQVSKCHQEAKQSGYTSISHDLVFGLPKQTLSGFEKTVRQTIEFKPDRLSLYSYAHVPWVKGTGQRGYDENDLPTPEEKRALYEMAKELFLEAGYLEIAMDHFALPEDELAKAHSSGILHRNFMGYTTNNTKVLIGLGMSAISDTWFGYAQNEKDLKSYQKRIEENDNAWEKGHLLSAQDLEIRKHINELMCQFETEIPTDSHMEFEKMTQQLIPMIEDGLVEITGRKVKVTKMGEPFVRNVCMAFDPYLNAPISKPTFSMTI
nr:oxygen-independent coproporphyrinogen III oxidase [uncultured Fluviicola sp.]